MTTGTIMKRKKRRKASGEAKVMIRESEIHRRVASLAREIGADYKNRRPVIIGVLKGCFIFIADLIRELKVPSEVDFIGVRSYAGERTIGMIKLNFDAQMDVQGRDVLLVDDIVDTGFSLAFLRKHLLSRAPRSLEVCVLLDKPSRRKVHVPVRYTGFTIPDRFVVGYGLDFNEQFRGLPYIGTLT